MYTESSRGRSLRPPPLWVTDNSGRVVGGHHPLMYAALYYIVIGREAAIREHVELDLLHRCRDNIGLLLSI